ncbi:ubiquitin-like protein Pup [Raineyella fluvialis]|uniref:Prokaryotic ubiquitin-like protein Pup n=1 Tax=Raineyella fluvialis TaxID=2662261 RepID=A0A5Q2FG93_9ACTN|nr:ubiquitin-like protein Pup [Raineyella fluvialis]QGF24544.1 ubiquitin-like protein Pup [Raineyella fluvialis]
MSEQQHARHHVEESTEEVEAQRSTRQQEDEGFDALLDQIDAVLETNAEEFVRGFVQKGGQ